MCGHQQVPSTMLLCSVDFSALLWAIRNHLALTRGHDSDDGLSGCRLSERNEKLNQDSFSDKSKKWQCGRCHGMDAKTSPSRIMVLLFESLGRLPRKIPQL